MQRVLRWFGIIIGLLFAAFIGVPAIAILILVVFNNWNDARPLLAGAMTTVLGRHVAIGGNLDVDLRRVSHIHLENLSIANADWGHADKLLTIGSLDIALALRPLLSGKVVIPSLQIADTRAALERRPDGVGNWSFGGGSENTDTDSKDGAAQLPLIQRLKISNATVTFDDRRMNKHFDLALSRLEGGEDEARKQLSFSGEGTYQGNPASLEASMGSYAILQQHQQPYPLDVRLIAGDFRAHVAGKLGDPMALEGLDLQLDIAGDDLSNLLPLTGIPIPPSPPYRLTGGLERHGSSWVFKDFSGLLGSSDMRGTSAINLGGRRPRIEASVVSKLLDLKDLGSFIGASEGGAAPAAEADQAQNNGRVLPDKHVNLDALRSVDANISFKGTRIITPKVPIDRMDAKVSLEDGTFRVQPATFAIGKGDVRIFFSLYGASTPVKSDMEAQIENIDLVRLLKDFDFTQQIAGIFNGRIKLSATGTSIAEIAGSSNGNMMVVMSGGRFSRLLVELIGLDIAELLGVLIEGDESIPVRCIVADFAADQGVFAARTLVFDTTDTNILGSGQINMRDETLNIRLIPYPKDFSPLTLRTPLTIQGTLQQPTGFPDPANIGVEGGLKKTLNALLTLVTGVLPPIDIGAGKDAPCSALIGAARQHVGK